MMLVAFNQLEHKEPGTDTGNDAETYLIERP
jgi:hypothetical protein